MRVAITGSSGLIGTALRRALADAGHDVVRIVRHDASGRPDEVHWDPVAGELDPAALAGVDGVINLAGAGIGDKRWSDARKKQLYDSRVRSTTVLAEALAAMDAPPKVLLSGSGINWYGDHGDRVLTERSERGRSFLADLCVAWEAATAPAEAAGVRVAHLRTGLVLAPGGGALSKLLPLFKLGLGGPMGSGRQYWSWIALHDHVAAQLFLLEHPVAGPVNLTSPNPVTNGELSRALGRVLHRPAFLPVPAFGPKLVAGGELAQELLFTSARIVPQALLDAGFRFSRPELEPALRAALERA